MLLNFGNIPEFLILAHANLAKVKHPLKFEHHFINPAITHLSIKSLDTAPEQYNFNFNSQFGVGLQLIEWK
jgi:hypothetical protein